MFKGKLPHKIHPISDSISRPESHENPRMPNDVMTIPKNFATGEGIFDKTKQSELSSQDVELLHMNESNADQSEKSRRNIVKINPLF